MLDSLIPLCKQRQQKNKQNVNGYVFTKQVALYLLFVIGSNGLRLLFGWQQTSF